MSFQNATASYFALNKRLVVRSLERRSGRLTIEVLAVPGKRYRAGKRDVPSPRLPDEHPALVAGARAL